MLKVIMILWQEFLVVIFHSWGLTEKEIVVHSLTGKMQLSDFQYHSKMYLFKLNA